MKLIILIALTFISLSLIFISCNNKVSKITTDDFAVIYSKSKGRSKTKPQYSIEVKNNKVNYNGIANVTILGQTTIEITKSKLIELQKAFEESNFSSFDEIYRGRIRDLPMMSITYGGKVVKYQKREAPKKLLALAELLDGLISEK